jgi:hypothetical protein
MCRPDTACSARAAEGSPKGVVLMGGCVLLLPVADRVS